MNGNFMTNIYAQTDKKITDGSLFRGKLFFMLAMVLSLMFINFSISSANAAAPATPKSSCTMEEKDGRWQTTEQFKTTGSTIISDIILSIKQRLFAVNFSMYNVVKLNPQYLLAVQAALTLYIVVYGILFATGMVQVKTYDIITRMVKIGIVISLLSLDSWLMFNKYVVSFFDQLTDNTIAYVTNTTITGIPMVNSFISGIPVMSEIDSAVSKVISAKMFATLMAAAADKNYGIFYLAVMGLAILSFLRSLVTALWVYVMSLVMKALLYGLAPVFIPTILFNRTKHIFEGWLAQLVNATLQPILLFIFFVFFVKLLEGSIDNLLSVPVCFTKLPEGWRGSGIDFSFWRFMEYSGTGWKINTGDYEFNKNYNVSIVSVLTFLAIAEIASRFNNVVISISTQISNASTNLIGDGGPIQGLQQAMRHGLLRSNK